MRCQVPLRCQRRNRLCARPHGPYSEGMSRHGMPVRTGSVCRRSAAVGSISVAGRASYPSATAAPAHPIVHPSGLHAPRTKITSPPRSNSDTRPSLLSQEFCSDSWRGVRGSRLRSWSRRRAWGRCSMWRSRFGCPSPGPGRICGRLAVCASGWPGCAKARPRSGLKRRPQAAAGMGSVDLRRPGTHRSAPEAGVRGTGTRRYGRWSPVPRTFIWAVTRAVGTFLTL